MLIVGFIFVQSQYIGNHRDNYFNVFEVSLDNYLQQHPNDLSNLEALAKNFTLIESIHYVSLIEHKPEKSKTDFGLTLPFSDFHWLNEDNKSFYTQNHFDFIALPFEHSKQKYWLIAGIDTQGFSVYRYKGLIILFFAAAVTLFATYILASRLHKAINDPLEILIREVRYILGQESNKKLTVKEDELYSELAELFNEMLDNQQASRENMQAFVEVSTRELRETLETVEIQNIELDIARKNAVQASKTKSEFLANTSHELRTPLNGILGFSGLLLKSELSPQQRDYLSTIEQSAQGLLTIINDILDFSKLETGEITLEYKPVSIPHIIEEVFSLYGPQAHEKNLRLLSIVNPNAQSNLLGDPLRLKQVITNLISNAIKFSNRGNIIVRATALSETDNQVEIKFSVADNGIGLSHQQQEQLFDAFTKVDSSNSQIHGGAGLGLAIAKGLIQRMNGEIGVESEPNEGSTFWFTVKLGIAMPKGNQSTLANSLHGLSILVYDADPVCRMEITHHLRNWGVYYSEENQFLNLEQAVLDPDIESPTQLIIADSYTEENSFDKDKLVRMIHLLNARYKIPIIVLAPPSIQRLLQDDISGLNTLIVSRPIMHAQLHQAICSQLNITKPLAEPNDSDLLPVAKLPHTRRLKILVVDDNPANRKLVVEFLKGLGVEAHNCDSGEAAIDLCQKADFDLVFMDVRMPSMDGLEATKIIREQESTRRVPVVALTAHAVDEHKTGLLLAGMDDYLSKPVSEADLKMMIERWVPDSKQLPNNSSAIESQTDTAAEAASKTPKATRSAETKILASAVDSAPPEPEQEAAQQKSKLFDWSESMRLSKNKPDLAKDMLALLLESCPETLSGLESSLRDKDYEQLLNVCHKFHGGCCYCGVPLMREASSQLEKALHSKNLEETEALTGKLIESIKDFQSWAEEIDIDTLFAD